MTLLQLGIGTVNDIVDAPRDAGRKAGKPIPAGLVSTTAARGLAIVVFVAGTLLAVSASIPTGLLAPVVIAIGLAYDLRLKGTAWSWLPFAVGIPILPLFGWLGVTDELPVAFLVLLPAGVAAGAALAIGNTLVDVERDRDASVSSIAIALGPGRAWPVATGLLCIIWVVAVGSAIADGIAWSAVAVIAVVGLVPIAAAITSRAAIATVRERAWQAEAVGLALLAALWLAAMLAPGRSGG
jgi:4-hydroxybenzoate polyprenyltransferase